MGIVTRTTVTTSFQVGFGNGKCVYGGSCDLFRDSWN